MNFEEKSSIKIDHPSCSIVLAKSDVHDWPAMSPRRSGYHTFYTESETCTLSSLASTQSKTDVTIIAGSRLYRQAMESANKLEARRRNQATTVSYEQREPASFMPLGRGASSSRTSTESGINIQIEMDLEAKCMDVSTVGQLRAERLYNLSKPNQILGKKRREEIAQASLKRKEMFIRYSLLVSSM